MQAQQIHISGDAAHLVLQRRRWRRSQRRRMLWVRSWLEVARRIYIAWSVLLMPELRLEDLLESNRTYERDFVSVLPTSRQRSAGTPWKRGANAV